MKKIVFVWFLLSTFPAFAQKYYEKQFGWENLQDGKKITQKGDFYLIAGSLINDNTLLKRSHLTIVNASSTEWTRQDYGEDTFENITNDFFTTSDGGYFLLASSENLASSYVAPYCIWLDHDLQTSNTLLTSPAYSAQSYCGAQISNGDILIGGYIQRPNIDGLALHLVRLDSSGAMVFDTTYAQYNLPVRTSYFESISPTADGGAWLLASVRKSGERGDIAVIKINEHGDWQRDTLIIPEDTPFLGEVSYAKDLIQTTDGNLLITYLVDYPDMPSNRGYIRKLDTLLHEIWVNDEHFRGGSPRTAKELQDGSIIVGGCYMPDDDTYNLGGELIKLSSDGNLLWKRQFGGNGDDYVYDMILNDGDLTGKSGFVLCGRTESNLPGGRADVYFLKLNCMGLTTEPQAAFSYSSQQDTSKTVFFQNLSQYAYPDSIDGGHYLWDFGDGSPVFVAESAEQDSFSHVYPASGTYEVTLRAVVCSDTSVIGAMIQVGQPIISVSPVDATQDGLVTITPNPAANTINLKHHLQDGETGKLTLYDLTGRPLAVYEFAGENTRHIDTSNYPPGLYVYTVKVGEKPLEQGKLAIIR